MSLRRLAYTFLLYVIFPIVLLRLLWRSRSNSEYRKRWSERLGFVSKLVENTLGHSSEKPILWVHTVSVGEAIAAKPLIEELLHNFPSHRILMTTTTPTGSDRVKSMFAAEIESQQLIHTYFPYDLLGSVSRFVNTVKPQILIVVETEIWPNLYAKCAQKNIPLIMVNARLSEKSTQSYLKIKNLVAETLSKVTVIAVRSKSDADRFTSLGAKPSKIIEAGNIKYDIKVDKTQSLKAQEYSKIFNAADEKKRLVFVAASTHEGEDAKILFAYNNLLKQFPELLLVLVPRHPERFDQVYDDCTELLAKELTVIKHSEYGVSSTLEKQRVNVVLGDSMGEMQMWYALADVVFIGGSLVKTGGHNPLEATLYGVPVISGPYMFNFEDIASELTSSELLLSCNDEFELIEKLKALLNEVTMLNENEGEAKLFEVEANEFMQQHRGVTARLVQQVSKQLKS